MWQVDKIVGVDEVGYGSLAGDLYFCALQFIQPLTFQVFDSKKISEKKRMLLFEQIKPIAHYKIFVVDHIKINENGLAKAYNDGLNELLNSIHVNKIIMDGNFRKSVLANNVEFVVKGDSLVPEISAASIVAKVLRDEYMNQLHLEYPQFEFNQNKGYGTKAHLEKIGQFGLSNCHRKVYNLSKYLINS